MACPAVRAHPLTFVQLQVRLDIAAARASFAARLEASYLDDILPVTISLVFQHTHKLAPRSALNGLCEMTVMHHPRYVQVFQADCVVSDDNL